MKQVKQEETLLVNEESSSKGWFSNFISKAKIFLVGSLKGWVRGNMTADDARSLAVFGSYNYTFEQAVLKKIEDLEELIDYKSSGKETVAIKTIDKVEVVLYEEVAKHFKKQGFKVILKTFPELEGDDYQYLIISWR